VLIFRVNSNCKGRTETFSYRLTVEEDIEISKGNGCVIGVNSAVLFHCNSNGGIRNFSQGRMVVEKFEMADGK